MAKAGKLSRIHAGMHATHKSGGGQEPIGAIRIEEGSVRNPDGKVDHERREWKVYRRRELNTAGKADFHRAHGRRSGREGRRADGA